MIYLEYWGRLADKGKGTDRPKLFEDKGKGADILKLFEAKGKATDKQKLFEDASTDSKPRARTTEEIKAKYRKAGTGVNRRSENSVNYAF